MTRQLDFKNTFTSPSVILLIVVNFIPIIGVIFFSWDIFSILLLYWLESAVIGIFNILKMLVVGRVKAIFFAVFFLVHYSGFMFGHFMFINFLFNSASFDFLSFNYLNGILLALGFLFVSHGVSFFYNFIGREEYKKSKVQKLFSQPYKRIFVMHLVIIASGFFFTFTGIEKNIIPLIILIIMKIFFDTVFHRTEHRVLIKNIYIKS